MIKLFLQKMEFTVAEENGCKIPMLVQIMEQRDEKLVIFPVRKEIHTGLLIPFIRNVGDIAPQNVRWYICTIIIGSDGRIVNY